MRFTLLPLLLFFCVLQKATGQSFISRWQYEWGGDKNDILANMIPLPGNQYLFGGSSASDPSCTKSGISYGDMDFALFVLDDNGNKVWEKTYGGAGDDELYYVEKVPSGGYILTGFTYSGPSGIKTSPSYGDADVWVVRVDDNGTMLWEKSYGGAQYERGVKIIPTPDGGFLVGGISLSNFAGYNYGIADYLLLKLDANGNLQWQKLYGGTGDDELQDLLAMPDGNYLLCGYSGSPVSGNKTAPSLGGADTWLICIKPDGTMVWDKTYGTSLDEYGGTLLALQDGNYLITGETSTSTDFIRKVDPQGNELWYQTCLGYAIFVRSVQDANGNIYVGAYSDAGNAGCKTSPLTGGVVDIWIPVYDAAGNKIDDLDYGGDGIEYASDVKIVNGDLWIMGYTNSFRNGNKTVDRCGLSVGQSFDGWIIRLTHSLYIHSPTPTEICSSTTNFNVDFTANNLYQPGNVFTAELSDANGSFAIPIDIGSLAGTGSGIIPVTLPPGLALSDQYKIRVVASLPTDISSSYSLSIHGSPQAFLGNDTTICDNLPLTLTPGPQPPGTQFQWSDGSSGSSLVVSSPGLYSCDVQNSCGTVHTSINITTKSIPIADIGSDIHFCEGTSTTLQSSPQPADVSFLWNTGAATSSISVNTGGAYWLHTTNVCGSTGDTILITRDPRPVSQLDKDSILCAGTSSTLDPGPGFAEYLWNNFSHAETRTVNKPGLYWVRIKDNNGCITQDTVTITRLAPTPAAFLPQDTSLCSYEELTLSSTLAFKQYVWSTGDFSSSIHVTSPGLYWLEGTDRYGCSGADSILISPKQCPYGFFMPSAFTPNQDGRNDLCRPLIYGRVSKFSFTIYDRWGQKVFETSDPRRGWDGYVKGHAAEAGAFVWFCSYQLEGVPEQFAKGTVLLVR
jgi:gliding motility-associated-like protein